MREYVFQSRKYYFVNIVTVRMFKVHHGLILFHVCHDLRIAMRENVHKSLILFHVCHDLRIEYVFQS